MEEASIGRQEAEDKIKGENKTIETVGNGYEIEAIQQQKQQLENGFAENGRNTREKDSDENLKMVNHCYNRTVIDMNDIKANLTEIYLNHPDAFEEWLVSESNEDLIKRITQIKLKQRESKKSDERDEAGSGSEKENGEDGRTRRKRTERNNSVTSELFHIWVSSSPKKTRSPSGSVYSPIYFLYF